MLAWLHSPAFAERAQALGHFARYDSSLSPDLSELAILVTARIWGSEFEWSHHAPLAEAAGIAPDAIARIARAERPALQTPQRQAVFDFAVELHRDRVVRDDTFARAAELLGEGIVDLIGICGYYTLISMTINAVEIPADGPPGLPQLELATVAMFR